MKKAYFILFAAILLTPLFAQWSDDPASPTMIAGFPAEQVLPKVAITDCGHTYISRFDNNGGAYKVYLNLLALDGTAIWTEPNGLLVSDHDQMSWLTEYDLTVDNGGNAVVVFQDIRNAGVNNVVAYKISSEGEFLWGADGIALSSDTSTDYGNMSPVVFNSADNSIYIAWQRLGTGTNIVMNRLSPDGQKLWGESGITLALTEGSYTWPQIIQADGDNVLLKYYHDTGPFWAPTRHIYVAKYSPAGQELWNTVMTDAGGIPAWEQLIPFESDGSGGGILAWYEDRDSNMDNDVYCQRVASSGNISMPEDGALMSVDPVNQQYYPKLAVDPLNEDIYAFFRVTDADQNSWGLARQMLDFSGNRLWSETALLFIDIGGVEVNTVDAYFAGQGAVCLYEFNTDNLGANCWTSSGTQAWGGATTLASTGSVKYHFDMDSHPDNWCVLAWEQGSEAMDISAMRLNGNGSLGMEYPSPRELTVTFLPPDGALLEWQAPSQYIIPDHYYVYMNGELGQIVAGDVLSHEFTGLAGGSYDFYVTARYGDHYSEPSNTVTLTIVSNDDAAIPAPEPVFSIRPNPFQNSATLVFSRDRGASECRLSVYNLRGQKLAEKVLRAEPGVQEIPVSALDLNLQESGIYLFRLETGGDTREVKAILMK